MVPGFGDKDTHNFFPEDGPLGTAGGRHLFGCNALES